MDKNRLAGKISRLKAELARVTINRAHAVDCLRSEVNSNPEIWGAHTVGIMAVQVAKVAAFNLEIVQIESQIDYLDNLG